MFVLSPYLHNPANSIVEKDDFVTFAAANDLSAKPQYTYNSTNVKATKAHVITLSNPLNHFSVELPEGGCGHKQTVYDNAKERSCVAATNAGFFVVASGDCIGNVVAGNGTEVYVGCSTTPNFGLTKHGEFLAGYVTCETIKKHSFRSLVQGAGWLVKNGASYLHESIKLEKISSYFINLKAPRVAIGVDKHGRLLMVQVDGNEPTKEGFDLYEMTDLMLQLGAVHAINLDGGGSSTTYVDGQVHSRCTDKCAPDTRFNPCPNASIGCCQRRVTTIICVK